LLSIAGTRYVLIEPPHHVVPIRLEDVFFGLLAAGYVPILTHPERLSWVKSHYPVIERLFQAGVWMQITAGSLWGAFGPKAQYWAELMLSEGRVHILATDAHDLARRSSKLSNGRDIAARQVGIEEAEHLVSTRPRGILADESPSSLPRPPAARSRLATCTRATSPSRCFLPSTEVQTGNVCR
jgi:protein-tyrosine phosphatase